MKGSMRFWTDVALGRVVRTSASPEAASHYGLLCALAQLVKFWRRDLPPYWEEKLGGEIPSSLAYDAFDRLKPSYLMGKDVDLPIEEFVAALEAKDTAQLPQLSSKGWQVVKDVTGLGREEWEQVPVGVREAMEKRVTCPKCNSSGTLAAVANLMSAPDPFDMGSGASLHFACRQCATKLTLDTAVKGLEITQNKLSGTKNVVFWAALVGVLIVIWAMMRHFVAH